MILSDCHLHSSNSGDSTEPMEEMILKGISQGLTTMCFTEHNDFDMPVTEQDPEGKWEVDTDAYLEEYIRLRDKYKDKIRLLFGVELGLQPSVADRNRAYVSAYDFDFIIGSSHLAHGMDPYYPEFYEGRTDEEAYREYFESILENINEFLGFDVYGHLDYVVRYGRSKDENYSYARYSDIFDEILKKLIENGKGIELNTGGVRKGMRDVHPCTDVIKRYRELGGEIITVGSDSHDTRYIAADFDRALYVLEESGFKYYTVFEKRKPEFIRLS